MSVRQVLRIFVCLGIIAALWLRALNGQRWSGSWLFGGIGLTIALLLIVAMEIAGRRTTRRPRDDVPKRPLGLDV